MMWLPLALALEQAGCSFALLGNGHSSRLRGALAGKNKSDVIDAEVLSHADELFGLAPARLPDAAELALRRAVLLRHKAVLDANRARRRLLSQARWAAAHGPPPLPCLGDRLIWDPWTCSGGHIDRRSRRPHPGGGRRRQAGGEIRTAQAG